jgi:hypothetical protein
MSLEVYCAVDHQNTANFMTIHGRPKAVRRSGCQRLTSIRYVQQSHVYVFDGISVIRTDRPSIPYKDYTVRWLTSKTSVRIRM